MSNVAPALSSSAPVTLGRRVVQGLAGLSKGEGMQVFKVVLAALSALLISLVLDLDSPRTAMFSVFLVMQARSGLVFQKSYYRLIGTVVGGAVSVMLIAACAQSPELFFAGFALWVAFCTAGSFVFRNFQSYGFVLAGYTVCFVALPSLNDPLHVFDVAVTRVLEMFVGVFCAAVVSDTLFPQRMADVVKASLARRFHDFTATIGGAPAKLRAGDTGRDAMLRFAGDALGLESAQANAGLESSDLRRSRLQLQLLNHRFMGVSSTLHAFHQMLRRLGQGTPLAAGLLDLYEPFSRLCREATGHPRHAAPALAARIAHWQAALPAQAAALRQGLALPAEAGEGTGLDFDTGVELLQRLAEELRAYCQSQVQVESPEGSGTDWIADAERLRFSTRTDTLQAFTAAGRGVLVMAVTACFWLASGWVWGTSPIINGVASGTIFAALPNPTKVIRQSLLGSVLALPLGLAWNFFLIPQATDWVGLCLLLIPPLALIAWLAAKPRWAGLGAGMYISFMLHTSLDRSFSASLPDYFDACLADMVGFVTAGVFYSLIDLNAGPWGRRRIVGALRRQMVEACRGPGRLQREVLESASRDLVQRIATRGQLADATDLWVFDWLLTVLEVGRAAIDLRNHLEGDHRQAMPLALSLALDRLAALFEQPGLGRRQQAREAVECAILSLAPGATPALPDRLRRGLMLDLHFIRGALADPVSVLDSAELRHG
ncbi:FUSC family protein [Denitratisoma sp. agr-D3]